MKPKLAYVALMISTSLAVAQDKNIDRLRSGIVEEDVNHNLDKAVEAYQVVLKQFDETRKTAATAAFRLAECYRKQGKRDQAVSAYSRVIREFGDQSTLADQSRSQLSRTYGIDQTRPAVTREQATQDGSNDDPRQQHLRLQLQELRKQYTENHPEILRVRAVLQEGERIASARSHYRSLLEEEVRLVEDQIKEEQRKIDTGVADFENLNKLKRDLLALKRTLAIVDAGDPLPLPALPVRR